jgi:ribonuclease Z
MGQIIILGTSNAIPDEKHENTHFAIVQGDRVVMVDCVGNPIVRLKQAGIDLHQITDVIVTHFHPDHVSGVPILLMDMWLLGRTQPLRIHGLAYTLDRLEAMMNLYSWQRWPGFFEVLYHRVPDEELAQVIDDPDLRILASPVKHLLPTLGLRMEFIPEHKVAAYSCDTEPCRQVVKLAAEADLLIHEATGDSVGHSSPEQAGKIAQEADADRLYLIHFMTPSQGVMPEDLVIQAQKEFGGPVIVTADFMHIDLN